VTTQLGLRAIAEDDRWRLHTWRNSERVRSVSGDDEIIAPERHDDWFDRALRERAGQIRVVEWRQRPVGLVQLEALDREQATGAWGCYLGETDVPPGVGAALPLLGLGLGFGGYQLRRMTAEVLGINANMLAIHRRLKVPGEGVRRRQLLRADGLEVDVHLFGVHRDEWPALRDAGLALLPSHIRHDVAALTDERVF